MGEMGGAEGVAQQRRGLGAQAGERAGGRAAFAAHRGGDAAEAVLFEPAGRDRRVGGPGDEIPFAGDVDQAHGMGVDAARLKHAIAEP